MYAIIKNGGRQHLVEVGRVIAVNRLEAEVGSSLEIDDVVFVKDDAADVKIGTPKVEGAKVVCEVVEHFRDKKIIVFKKKRRKKYRRKKGHRQDMTRLKIQSIHV